MEEVSLRELSKTLPKLLTGFFVMVGMTVPVMLNLLSSTSMDLDIVGLNYILPHSTSFTSPCRVHRQPGTDSMVTVRSSINTLMGGWH